MPSFVEIDQQMLLDQFPFKNRLLDRKVLEKYQIIKRTQCRPKYLLTHLLPDWLLQTQLHVLMLCSIQRKSPKTPPSPYKWIDKKTQRWEYVMPALNLKSTKILVIWFIKPPSQRKIQGFSVFFIFLNGSAHNEYIW